MSISPAAWTPDTTALWKRLLAHPFEHPEDGLDLTRRLARDQGWSLAWSRAVLMEYRRFCFLCRVATEPMTPSQEVDEVWHLHLTDTRDYWERFCPRVLGGPLHHFPTCGGPAEARRYREQYARTLAAYEAWFGPPPPAFWPGTRDRFADPVRFRRIDRRRHLILPRPRPRNGWRALFAAFAILGAGTAGALPLNPLDWTAAPFLSLFLALAIGVGLFSTWQRERLRETGQRLANDLDPYQLAYLAGGAARAVDAGVTDLLVRAQVGCEARSQRLQLIRPRTELSTPLRSLGTAIALNGRPRQMLHNARGWFAPIHAELVTRGLVLGSGASYRVRRAGALPLLALALFGAAKILIGAHRGHPVGLLIVLTLLVAGWGLYRWFRPPLRTRAGDRALDAARLRHARALRAPTTDELVLAVAMQGITALAGTAYADYRGVHPPASGDGGGDGGDGGSGCGGCGGD